MTHLYFRFRTITCFGIANGQISSIFDSYLPKTYPYFSFRTTGVTIHRKYGSPRYEAGGSVHGPFFGNFGSGRFTQKKILRMTKLRTKIAEKLLKCCFYVESYLILLY